MRSSIPASSGKDWPQRMFGLLGFAVLIGICAPNAAFAHGGEIELGGGAKGPVQLTAAQQSAIGLDTAVAGPHPLATLLSLNGEVQLLPDRQADVSLRISGQVKELSAKLGDSVRAGQRLALVESRLLGDPPPSVDRPPRRLGVHSNMLYTQCSVTLQIRNTVALCSVCCSCVHEHGYRPYSLEPWFLGSTPVD